MKRRFLVDTCIWIDLYEDRKGYGGEPLGGYAYSFFSFILGKRHILVITDQNIMELEKKYTTEEINGMMNPFKRQIERIIVTKEQYEEGNVFADQRNVPIGDALLAVMARDSSSLLVTRDRHFRDLLDIAQPFRPEEII